MPTHSGSDETGLEWLGYAVATALWLYGAVILIGQVIYWLRYGSWLQIPLSELLQPVPGSEVPFPLWIIPHSGNGVSRLLSSWEGIAKIERWLLDVNLSIWCFILGGWSGSLATHIAGAREKRKRDEWIKQLARTRERDTEHASQHRT